MTRKASISARARRPLTAAELMTSPAVTTKATAKVREAAALMLKHNVGAVAVIDESGAVVGIASDGDLAGKRLSDQRQQWWLGLITKGLRNPELDDFAHKTTVAEVMSTPPLSVSPDTPLPTLVELLRSHGVKRLPVIDAGRLIGIVSRADLLDALSDETETPPAFDRGARAVLDFLESMIGGASLDANGFVELVRLAAAAATG